MALSIIGILLPSTFADWKSGERFPEIETLALDENDASLAGKVTLVDFWASWCVPCKTSFPSMESLYTTYKDRGFQILAINVDDNLKAKDQFLKRMKPSFNIALDSEKKAVQSAGIDVIPSCYLVDRNGVIRLVHQGWHGKTSSEELAFHIEQLLEEESK
ncbi:MAG: TlpA family protein disulfide reductase [Opitutales bacterium]|nr:TlpA family protein disulfide reductase [Opitutales bacterium]MBT5815246.1 TlpA family protein disulfide reductase [Opitutales bacterium]